ncbi:MAG: hypothetical protein UT24_C0003G0010 [Candidatus Woesebacteria bacterium GW2011_GWB1_39_12]|uniref:Uncharacterized protein n=1 Tax=Candidatus Woesebacteria bacterium GW2011_GWB1_39_12 TaxID=1618574 RepID=A0A0G0MEK1_9BACT|nr:MAG: hypothetical protein UT24_C0003G0010 [Candidatus Woesebacteria bacterium GW2011_GWB1_39_12]
MIDRKREGYDAAWKELVRLLEPVKGDSRAVYEISEGFAEAHNDALAYVNNPNGRMVEYYRKSYPNYAFV